MGEKEVTSIALSKATVRRLRNYKDIGVTYEEAINRILDEYEALQEAYLEDEEEDE